jgi:hypothetical protein
VEEILPQGAGEHDKLQLTPLLSGSLLTVATMLGTVPVASTVASVGVIETVIGGIVEESVMVADPDLELSAAEVALTVMVKSLGGGALGAL